VTKRDAEFRLEVEAFLRQRKSVVEMPVKETRPPSGVFGWLTPLLQGMTVVVVIGSVFWMGQLIGTVSTKVDALQKSVDKIIDWKDGAAVSIGSLNTKVDSINSKLDDRSNSKSKK
jgi:hypothetical protein